MRALTPMLAAATLALPASPSADEITEALSAAIAAYEAGEIADALDELAYAEQQLRSLQAEDLTGHLPPALDGWTREISEEAGAGLGFIGGGVAAEATYRRAGDSFIVTLMADNPMVMQMGAMLGNRAMMAIMGEIVRVSGETFLKQDDDDLTGLIGDRVLVQASGSDIDAMVAHLEQIDFAALETFGQ